ncbi:MAG: hypothetical protein ACK4WC_05505 [Rubrimonas sp.]
MPQDSAPLAADAPAAKFVAMNQQSMAAAAAMTEGMLAIQQHLVAFAQRRLRHDLETAAAMAQCREAPKALEIAQTFCAAAMADYAEEAQAIARMTSEITAEAARKATRADA